MSFLDKFGAVIVHVKRNGDLTGTKLNGENVGSARRLEPRGYEVFRDGRGWYEPDVDCATAALIDGKTTAERLSELVDDETPPTSFLRQFSS